MNISTMVKQNRTVRRFREYKEIPSGTLQGLVDVARLSGSARNSQVLKYMIVALPLRIFY